MLRRFQCIVGGIMLGVGGILCGVTHFAIDRRAVEPIAAPATTATATPAFIALTIAFFTTRFGRRSRTRARGRCDAAVGRVDFELAAVEFRDLEQPLLGELLDQDPVAR